MPGMRTEMIGNNSLVNATQELLKAFERSTHQRPQRIIFFRDGVSEGQFRTCLAQELPQLYHACETMGDGESFHPDITFVIVQKRHHTRLFVDQADMNKADRSGNVPPGTVVDTEICHPSEYDFFLMSHAGLQGTSRPTHYHVLRDDNKFAPDKLQSLCYHLCHLQSRCTRSVSLVPPVYWAHIAADKRRLHLMALVNESDSQSSTSGASGSGPQVPNEISNELADCMFFA